MLVELLEKAVRLGSSCIELEYEGGKQWVTALFDNAGCSIGCLDSSETKSVLKEMEQLAKAKHVILGGARYQLVFTEYESFGEWVQPIHIKMDRGRAAGQKRRPRRS